MAAYVLTDWTVIQALTRRCRPRRRDPHLSRRRPVGSRDPKQPFRNLTMTPGVVIKTRQTDEPLMLFKSYQIDGARPTTARGARASASLRHSCQKKRLVISARNKARLASRDRSFGGAWEGKPGMA
jgi:hypothetical protein